jgi:hypothetical protein
MTADQRSAQFIGLTLPPAATATTPLEPINVSSDDATAIQFQPCPSTLGRRSRIRYAIYGSATTMGELRRLNPTHFASDLQRDLRENLIKHPSTQLPPP